MIRKVCLLGAAWLALATPARAQETKVYELPPGTFVQNVAQAPDGKLWLAAQRPGALGVLDPKTGQTRFVPLGEKAAPIIVAVGKDGNAYLTDLGQNAIVRVDAKTDAVKIFPVPQDGGQAAVNSLAFDHDGLLWFTARGATDIYGRLDVATGEMKIWRGDQGRASQGIAVTPNNEVWYVSVVGSYIARIDRATATANIVKTTQPAVEPHGIWSDSKGNLWVDLHNSGVLARYAPKTGKWSNWRLPGGKPPHAFGVFVDDKDLVWVVQSTGNAVYAFDPKSEKFVAQIPGSNPNANVRRITGGRGEVWVPEASASRLVVVKTTGLKAPRSAVNTNLDAQDVVLKAGGWAVRKTPDGMTGKKSCTGFHRDDYQVLLTDDMLFINQAKNGGLKEYSLRYDEEPAGTPRAATSREELLAGATLGGADLTRALASKRLRLHIAAANGGVTDEDIDVTGIKAAHDMILGGKDCH